MPSPIVLNALTQGGTHSPDAFGPAMERGARMNALSQNMGIEREQQGQRNQLFQQNQDDRQRTLSQQDEQRKLVAVRDDLSAYLIARKQGGPQGAQQAWAQIAPKYNLQDKDPEQFVPEFIRANPGILGEASDAVLKDFFAPKQPDLTTNQREYAAAQQQGYKGTLADWMRDQKTSVQQFRLDNPTDKKPVRNPVLDAADKKRFVAFDAAALTGEDTLARLKEAEALVDAGTYGATPLDRGAMIAGSFGMNDSPKVANTSALQQIGAQLVLAKGSLGAGVSVYDAKVYAKAAGDFENAKTDEVRRKAIETMRPIAERAIERANNARAVYEQTGRFPDFKEPDAAPPAGGTFNADKERRYQEWKARQ